MNPSIRAPLRGRLVLPVAFAAVQMVPQTRSLHSECTIVSASLDEEDADRGVF